jgi:hypothetical protein
MTNIRHFRVDAGPRSTAGAAAVERPERPDASALEGRGPRDALLVLALVLLALALGVGSLLLRPDRHQGAEGLLFGDIGYNFWVVDRLLSGDRLFAEVAYQYGPLPAYLHASAAAVFGNTIATFHGLLLAISLLNVLLATLLIRSVASRTTTAVVVGLGLTASLLVPGSLLGGNSNSVYIPLERTLVLLAALAWSPPLSRPRARAILLGVAIGGWQLVRFGGGVFLGAALVATDLLALWWTRSLHREGLGRWVRSLLITAGVAAGIQVAQAAVALATLPEPIAWDYIWPAYVLESYAGWVTTEVRWPRWGGWNLLIGQYLSPLVGGAAGLLALAWYLRHRARGVRAEPERSLAARSIRLLLPLIFFLIASVGMFRMAYHFLQFAWALVIPAAWLFQRSGWAVRGGMLALLVPCFALNARSIFVTPPAADQEPFRTPRGEVLWATPAVREELEWVASEIASAGRSAEQTERTAMILPLGAGFHYAFGVETPLRQVWFLPGFARPYDNAQIAASLDGLDAVVVRDPADSMIEGRPCSWRQPSPLSPTACAALAERLGEPRRLGRHLVYPVVPAGSGGRPDAERLPER